VIGNQKNFIGPQNCKRKKIIGKRPPEEISYSVFELFDAKLAPLKEQAFSKYSGTRKQWLMTGKKASTSLMLTTQSTRPEIICSRYADDPLVNNQVRILDSLPFYQIPSAVLLISSDHSKFFLLLLKMIRIHHTCSCLIIRWGLESDISSGNNPFTFCPALYTGRRNLFSRRKF
jgi:hypothetical protein